jgi:hypothetical protein
MYTGSVTSLAVFASINLLGLAGGLFFAWRAIRRTARFVRLARRSTFSAAMMRAQQAAYRQAYRCATDVHYYLSRIALMFCVNLVALTAVIFTSVGLLVRPESGSATSVHSWALFATCSVFVFVAFLGWSVTRTVRLARRVLRIRRNIRTVTARRRRSRRRLGALSCDDRPGHNPN